MSALTMLKHLDNDLDLLCVELRSQKLTNRHKAFEKLDNMLNNRSEEMEQLLSQNIYEERECSWEHLFDYCFSGIMMQIEKIKETRGSTSALEGKNYSYVMAVQKLLNTANKDEINVNMELILRKVFKFFDEECNIKEFFTCFIQILNRHVINSKFQRLAVKVSEWSRILSYCFELNDNPHISKLTLATCISSAIENSLCYASMHSDLLQYIPMITGIVANFSSTNDAVKMQHEWLKIAYMCCQALSFEYRFVVCKFTEDALHTMHNIYWSDDNSKIIYYKIMHLATVVHHPDVSNSKLNYVVDPDVWHKHLRNAHYIVEKTIKTLNSQRSLNNNNICEYFVQFAVRLSYLIFWNDDIWKTNCEQSDEKRVRRVNKMQALMDNVAMCGSGNSILSNRKYCWRWFIILSELIYQYPESVTGEDYQPLLDLLVNYQDSLELPCERKAFFQCCYQLLQNEEKLTSARVIDLSFCNSIWHKIAEKTSRLSLMNNANASDNHIILQLLIAHKKYSSPNFITTIINAFVSHTVIKTDITLLTLIRILENFNIDSLKDSKDLIIELIDYIQPKLTASNLRANFMTTSKISPNLSAQLYVMCCLVKTDILKVSKRDDSSDPSAAWLQRPQYLLNINELENNLRIKMMDKLLMEDCKLKEINSELLAAKQKLPSECNCILIESFMSHLCERIFMDMPPIPENNETDLILSNLCRILSNMELKINIINELILYEALKLDNYKKFYLTKRISLKLQGIEMYFDLLLDKVIDDTDILVVLKSLLGVFSAKYHPALCLTIRNNNFSNLVKWLDQILDRKFDIPNSKEISVKQKDKISDEMECKHAAVSLVVNMCRYSGPNNEQLLETLLSVEFNLANMMELTFSFNIVQNILLHYEPTAELAEFTMDIMKYVCRYFNKYEDICHLLMDFYSDYVIFIRDLPDFIKNARTILATFLELCIQNKFSTDFTIKIIEQIKFVQKAFPHLVEDPQFADIYRKLMGLLKMNVLTIQLSVCKCITHLINPKWLTIQPNANEMKVQHKFNVFLYEAIEWNGETEENAHLSYQMDYRQNRSSYILQLLSNIIIVSGCLNKRAAQQFYITCYRSEIEIGKVRSFFEKMIEQTGHNYNSFAKIILPHILSKWITENFPIAKFPWYLSNSTSPEDFFGENIDLFTLCILRHKCSRLEELSGIVKKDMKSLVQSITYDCLAYVVPIRAGCNNLSPVYQESGLAVFKMLSESLKDLKIDGENIHNVVRQLLLNIYDENHFEKLFKFQFVHYKEPHMINVDQMKICLQYLFKRLAIRNCHSLFSHFCMNQPYNIQHLLFAAKMNVVSTTIVEQQLIHFFQYCLLVEWISEFLVTSSEDHDYCKHFLIREIIYFLCHLMEPAKEGQETQMIRFAASRFFYRFCNLITVPCSHIFEQYINYIVAFLIPLCKDKNEDVATFVLNFVKYLVVDQNQYFSKSIKLLDNFPSDPIFDEIREVQMVSKYKNQEFSLSEEIEHFLSVEPRKLEGFIELKEKLATQKAELKDIYKGLATRLLFSEDCDTSPIHRLINVLIKNIKSPDELISFEAAKCLGELGTSDLNTMVLKFSSHSAIYQTISSYDEAIQKMLLIIIEKLNDLVIHDNMEVARAACLASYHIFEFEVARQNSDKFMHLYPFVNRSKGNKEILCKPQKAFDLLSVLLMDEYADYETWVQRICCSLFQTFNEAELMEMAALNVPFSEEMLPLLVQTILAIENSAFNQELREFVTFFFNKHFQCQKSSSTTDADGVPVIYMNEFIIKMMLNICECIRNANKSFSTSLVELNYLHIAKAAQYCHAYFTSIIYCELYALGEGENEKTFREKDELQDILYDGHIAIGITDAMEAFINPVKNRFKYLELQKSKTRLLLHLDAQSVPGEAIAQHYADNLFNSGLIAASQQLMANDEKKYECAWRMNDWNLLVDSDSSNDKSKSFNATVEYEKQHYLALRCLANDETGTHKAILEARRSLMILMKSSTLECTANIYRFLSKLQQLQQIEDFAKIHFIKSQNNHLSLIDKWREQDQIPYSDFVCVEPVMSQRLCVLSRCGIRARRSWVPQVEQNTFFQIISEARKNNQDNIAIRNIAQMYSLELNKDLKAKLVIEDSQLNFSMGDTNLATKLLMEVLTDKTLNVLIKAVALRIHGEYLATNSSEEYRVIHHKFFRVSIELIESYATKNKMTECLKTGILGEDDVSRNLKDAIKTFEAAAQYVDREYVHLNNEIKSLNFARKEESLLSKQKTLSKLTENHRQLNRDEKVCMTLWKKATHIDEQEMKNMRDERNKRATFAMIYYLRYSLANPNASNLCIFRIITLWLSNKKVPEIKSLVAERLHFIPSHRFLELLPQITPRLGDENEDVSNAIALILTRCAADHPHHTLNHILSLANSYKDESAESSSSGSDQEPRVIKAQKLLRQLEDNKKISAVVQQMSRMSDALIELANKDISSRDKTKQRIKISSSEGLLNLKALNLVHCPTVHLPISFNCNYQNSITSIVKWSEYIFLVGGINSPKKIECLCSDGVARPQLLKGKDDLRQDAVMQQVFTVMNKLLQSDKEASKRKLSIRTYKVVPLSRRSGILEWCLNTLPIGAYLVSSGRIRGAHELYRPQDYPPKACFEKIRNAATLDNEKRYEVFQEICKNIRPVFHHFFFDNFCSPGVWFERRLAYTNSIATTSMIGYIMGIGDRHVQNILIDKKTAEVIHIDFGIAFELGKTLNTPETVPFRLTRDIVAPFGFSGVEGVFENACIKTMAVLRQNKQTILTILEVLLYDPLYSWNVIDKMENDPKFDCMSQYSKKPMNNKSREDDAAAINTTAERALERLSAKLNGKDLDITGSSIEGQVGRLIQQATNATNLSRLFCGWQAYL